MRCAISDDDDTPEELRRLDTEQEIARMRARLTGLFGTTATGLSSRLEGDELDGEALREIVRNKWGVEFDLQPVKRHDKVYLQIMWRYYGQQSFYLEENDWKAHMQAVAQLLNDWKAVNFFVDYVANIKKRRTFLYFASQRYIACWLVASDF